jgi:exopolyphosphatase/guanosine-5'-triphosphate,3'-diphosphate pyrophosphatase
VVRLSERMLLHDPPTDAEVQDARDWIAEETEAALADMPRFPEHTFVGTAGTITSLAAMAQQLPSYEAARIHNYCLDLETVRDLENRLLPRRKADRLGFLGLEKGREDVIAAGVIMLRTIMETLAVARCLVSDLGLREGVLLNLADRPTVHGSNRSAEPPAPGDPS